MKARVHWESRHQRGHTDWEEPGQKFRQWCDDLTGVIAKHGGNGFLAGSNGAIAYHLITHIEKLED